MYQSILAVLPVSAVFILFDLVIHNPSHRESRTNLSLLDTAAGYFSLVDIASNQALPGGILPEFAHIAREYFWKAQQRRASATSLNPPAAVAMTDRQLALRSTGSQDMEGQEQNVSQDANSHLVRGRGSF